ncbi:MAG: glycosyltransferase family 2 protein, partial [candidate division Zixibacteria bacterium]|nr:glycosyltransferase family 2 protein [candidate division Zixibacteria bacterium]
GTKRISVIMPAYNAEKHIADAIESVLGQTYPDFELLVVCDVSTDSTEDIIKAYAARDDRVRLLYNVHLKGVGGALNTGLENASGKYIARVDADDINRPYRFEKQFEFLDRHPEIFLLGGGYAPFNEKGHRIDLFHPTSSVEIAWKFISNTYFAHPTVMFRREVFETLGGYPHVEAEDFGYFSRVVRRYKCTNLPIILIDYRESLSNRSLVYADQVVESVKAQCLDNFKYYVGDMSHAELFYRFQNRNVLKLRHLPTLVMLNRKIISKIRSDYGLSRNDRSLRQLRLVILRDYFRKSVMSYFKLDPKVPFLRAKSILKRAFPFFRRRG